MNRILCGVLASLSISLMFGSWADNNPTESKDTPSAKKLIEYGWDVPTPDYVAAHIREMEQRPFDGLIFKLQGGSSVFEPTPWSDAKFSPDFEALPKIEWRKFTDNFVLMLAASDQDWFADKDWTAIEHNARVIAKAARQAKCVGVCFDAEPYGNNPWSYKTTPHRDTKSFTEYQAMARRRGAQFIRAIEQELPHPKVLTFFLDSVADNLLAPMPDDLRQERLSKHHYGLLPAFLEGMLEGSGPGVEFIDGNENAYYYTHSSEHFDAYHLMTRRALALVDPALWSAYHTKVRAGQALYVDQYYGMRKTEKTEGNYMPPEAQAKWFEYNTYWSLYTTDTYVWCYSEEMNWWKNVNIPPGSEKALESARAAIAGGHPLSFDLDPLMKEAKAKLKADNENGPVRRMADILHVANGTAAPTIDGDLSDPAWQAVKALEPFCAPTSKGAGAKLTAQTEARVIYDEKALYVGLLCHEPNPGKIQAEVKNSDLAQFFKGDVAEVFVASLGENSRFLQFAVNPKGAVRCLAHNGSQMAESDAVWTHAARIGVDSWTVEFAIPWKTLGLLGPSPELRLRANIGRERVQNEELSTWRGVQSSFLDPVHFGAWTLR